MVYRPLGRIERRGGFGQSLRLEPVAAARHRPDQAVAIGAKRAPQFLDALDKRIVGHKDIGPDRGDDFVLCDEPPGVFDKELENLERLRSERDVVRARPQGAAAEVKHVSVEADQGRLAGALGGRSSFARQNRRIFRVHSAFFRYAAPPPGLQFGQRRIA